MAKPDLYLELTDEIQARIESSPNSSDRISFQEVKNVTIQRKKMQKVLNRAFVQKSKIPDTFGVACHGMCNSRIKMYYSRQNS